MMNTSHVLPCLFLACAVAAAEAADPVVSPGARKLNNLTSIVLEERDIATPGATFRWTRPTDGWIHVAASFRGKGSGKIFLKNAAQDDMLILRGPEDGPRREAMRFLAKGEQQLSVECAGGVSVEKLVVRAIPELIHCGLGFDPALKSYGRYDLSFLEKDILPNITTTIVPHHIKLPQSVIDNWHRTGKRLVAEVGVHAQAKTAEDHFKYWSSFLDKAPFLDGIIVNEFIVNNPSTRPGTAASPERQARIEREQQRHRTFEEAIRKLRTDPRYKDKTFYAYVGGSGKKLNQEMIGPTFVRTLLDSGCRIALERYLHEMSSEQGSEEALRTFVEGIADWEAKQAGAKRQMVVTFGLFSMPPGGLNKLPNVDYHVWMDQQMNVLANHPSLSDIGGVEWWTSLQADEETVRFVGKLYRHYAIEGRTDRLTRDPLFMNHIVNADFEKGTAGWTLQRADEGTIEPRSFPRYGRIEGRFMGLGRPPDPEHIGDTFLWMKRSAKGPNTFSQSIKNLVPGRLYSMKMFTCDYQDLVNPKVKKREEATPFLGEVVLDGVEVDPQRSFTEMYASNPEPRIPVWITYHWIVFRAKSTVAKVLVSDWSKNAANQGSFGQEQTFNFLEIEPYHE